MINLRKTIANLLIATFIFTTVFTYTVPSYAAGDISGNESIQAEDSASGITPPSNANGYDTATDKSENAAAASLDPEDEKYVKTMASIDRFSEASADQLAAIGEYLGLDYKLLLEAEKAGYSKNDAVLAAQIIQKMHLSFEEIKEGSTHYRNLQSFSIAARQYANLLEQWEFSEKTADGIRKCLIQGDDVFDIEKSGVIAEIFQAGVEEVALKDNEDVPLDMLQKQYAPDTANEISSFLAENHISPRWFLDYTNKEKMDWEDFHKKVQEYFSSHLTTLTADPAGYGTNAVSPMAEGDEDEHKAPFSYLEYGEDRVEMNSGNLQIENTDVYLPGKNGLDFTLTSRYNSGETVIEKEYTRESYDTNYFDVAVKYDKYLNGVPMGYGIVDRTLSQITRDEYERLKDIYEGPVEISWESAGTVYLYYIQRTRTYQVYGPYRLHRWFTPTYKQKDSPLGQGWGFVFDSIEVVSGNSYYNNFLKEQSYFIDKVKGTYLHLENGQVYKINDNLTLADYKLNDMKIERDNTYTNGQGVPSYYVLKFKDGLKEYFAQDGRLLAKADRFNNRIEYQHTMIRNHPVITKIIDTLGRVVTINYDYENLQVVVTAPGNRQITYQLAQDIGLIDGATGDGVGIYTHKVVSRKDFENRVTAYQYDYHSPMLTYSHGTYVALYGLDVLTKMVFPTGSYVEYSYTEKGRFCTGGHEYYPTVIRRTIVDETANMESEKEYLHKSNYTKYPFVTADKNRKELSPLYPTAYSCIGMDVNDMYEGFEYRFNFNNLLIAKENYGCWPFIVNDVIYDITKEVMFNSIEYDYDATDYQLIQQRAKKYTVPESESSGDQNLNKYLLNVEDFKYDSYGNLTRYWGADASRDGSNRLISPNGDSHLVEYSYDTAGYHLMTLRKYQKDAATTIREEYALTPDRRNVLESVVKVNGTQKMKTGYGYDAWNNINSEKRYLEAGGWTNYIETLYEYQDNDPSRNGAYNFNGAYITRKYTPGVTDADGVPVGTVEEKYNYDDDGNVIQYTDPNQYQTNYQYDRLGRTVLKLNPDGSSVSYAYDDINNTTTVTDENGTKIRYLYDGIGNLLYIRDVATGGDLKTYQYDTNYRLSYESNYVDDDSFYQIRYEYYSDGKLKSKITKNGGPTVIAGEEYAYEDAYDLDGNGVADCSKTIRTAIGDSDSPSVVTTEYTDKNGNVIRKGSLHNGQENYSAYQYDYSGNRIEERSARANDEGWAGSFVTKYEYDYAGRPVKITDVNGYISTVNYDALGRAVSKTDNKGYLAAGQYATTYEYDNLGRVTIERIPFENAGSTIAYTEKKHYYDKNGNGIQEKVTNSKPGQSISYSQVEYAYDSRDRLVKAATFDNGTPENYTQYDYDAAGNKVRMYTGLSSPLTIHGPDNVIPGSDTAYSVTRYTYDRFGNLTSMTDPMNQTETYTYDLNGSLVGKRDRNGNETVTTYDGPDRPIEVNVTTPDRQGDVSIRYEYTLTGNRKKMTANGKTSEYRYDDLARLIAETESGGITKQYTYDAANNRKSFVLKVNDVQKTNTTYEYDKMDRLTGVYEDGVQQAAYTYDANGNRNTLGYANGTSTQYQYNLANKLTYLGNMKGSSVLSGYGYTYYLDGNQETKTDQAGKITTYAYDGLGRLVSESPLGEPSVGYSYDDSNNRKAMTVGNAVTNYEYDANSRLVSEIREENEEKETTRYYYDNNGNQVSKVESVEKPRAEGESETLAVGILEESDRQDATISGYNGLNQLTKTITGGTVATYAYNGDGLRSAKTVNGVTTTHVWDGDQMAIELDGTMAMMQKYVRGINLIYAEDSAGVKKYYLFNGHGDVVQLTNTTGDTVKSYDYDAFGNEKTIQTFDFGGENSVNLGNSSEVKPTENLTITMWIKPADSQNVYTDIISCHGGSLGGYVIEQDGSNTNKFYFAYWNGSQWQITDSIQLNANEWQHIALQKSENVIKFFVNGICVSDGSCSGNIQYYGQSNVYIGMWAELPGTRYFKGSIKDIGIWNEALSTQEIQSVMSEGSSTVDGNKIDAEKYLDTDTNPFRYSGEYFDKETGTYYLRARYYDPEIGRFISEDAYWGKDQDPLSLNLYTYCMNNPIMYIDPSGYAWQDAVAGWAKSVDDALFFGLVGKAANGLKGVLGKKEENWDYLKTDNPDFALYYKAGSYANLVYGVANIGSGIYKITTSGGEALVTSSGEIVKVNSGSIEGVIQAAKGAGISLMSAGNSGNNLLNQTKEQLLKSKKSYEKLIKEHQQKLDDYIKNPNAYDNQKLLQNAPSEQIRQQIINNRIKVLQNQINKQQSELDKIRRLLDELN